MLGWLHYKWVCSRFVWLSKGRTRSDINNTYCRGNKSTRKWAHRCANRSTITKISFESEMNAFGRKPLDVNSWVICMKHVGFLMSISKAMNASSTDGTIIEFLRMFLQWKRFYRFREECSFAPCYSRSHRWRNRYNNQYSVHGHSCWHCIAFLTISNIMAHLKSWLSIK